jgi:transcriptional regulator with XRE-family HTH domain
MNELYERIENMCVDMGINITQMCKNAGVPRGNLTDLKKGRQTGLSAVNLNKIANYFNVSTNYLLTGGQKEKAAIDVVDDDLKEYLDELRNRPEQRMLFSVTKTATKAQIEAIVRMVEEMQKDK